jgi:predicted dehydrogenase
MYYPAGKREECHQKFGARLAFDDYHKLLGHPDIDAVAVILRVPSHYEPTMAALNAGKHVYTEWPLGRTTAEAQEMADLAQAKGVQNMVGLQARAAPAILYAKELVESGYVGEVMSCHISRIQGGVLQRPSDRTWQRDKDLGANTLTITRRPALRGRGLQPRFRGCQYSSQGMAGSRYEANAGRNLTRQHPGQRQIG